MKKERSNFPSVQNKLSTKDHSFITNQTKLLYLNFIVLKPVERPLLSYQKKGGISRYLL